MCTYHETVGKELDAAVAEGCCGELKVAQVAGEDAGGERHGVVDEVNQDCGEGEAEEESEFDA